MLFAPTSSSVLLAHSFHIDLCVYLVPDYGLSLLFPYSGIQMSVLKKDSS